MWLFVLSVLAIGSVQSASVGYPYRTLWTYNPNLQGQYPIKSGSIHGYLRYLDNNGAGGVVDYKNSQPVYAVRQIKYINNPANPLPATSVINKSDDVSKIREACIRGVSLQEYQSLQRNIDALRSDGKEPSADKVLKLQTLEKIAFTSDFSLIADLPEVKLTLQDLSESIESLYKKSVQQSSNQQLNYDDDQSKGEKKTYNSNSNVPLEAIDETAEQKQAREEHLRIYNEQIAHLKQLELEHEKYVQEASLKSNIPQTRVVDNAKALAELEQAQQEHFRLWNEAKLRAEQAGHENGERRAFEIVEKQKISYPLTNKQNINSTSQNPPPNILSSEAQIFQNLKESTVDEQIYVPHQVVDTPEVARAREEHLRILHEANLKAQAVEKDQKAAEVQNRKLSSDSDIKYLVAYQNANYAHNFNTYKLDEKNIASQQVYNAHEVGSHIPNDQSQTISNYASALVYRAAPSSGVVDTPEVVKAREEHLRLVNEANLKAQVAEQQELNHTPVLKSQYEHPQLVQSKTSPNVQETAQVVQARVNEAKSNTNLAEQNEKLITLPAQEPQQLAETQIVEETPEVQRAREEHLRIFNAIKSQAVQEQAKQSRRFPDVVPQQNPILEYSMGEEERLLELERLREIERLQKEQQQLELDRIVESERLAEEKRQMEAELIRLRLEEEQRLEMERLAEAKRLQEEQEELQKLKTGEYQEIIIQNDSTGQQSQFAIIPNTQPLIENIEKSRGQQSADVVGQYTNNPFLQVAQVSSELANRLEHSAGQQSSHLKIIPVQLPTSIYQHNSVNTNTALHPSDNTVPAVRRVPSSHYSGGNKHQYIKDDNIKDNKYYHNTASPQPADTAVALSALEKATNEHFRAHEQALEQLRLARLQNHAAKDCN